jgi:hypothetical protein
VPCHRILSYSNVAVAYCCSAIAAAAGCRISFYLAQKFRVNSAWLRTCSDLRAKVPKLERKKVSRSCCRMWKYLGQIANARLVKPGQRLAVVNQDIQEISVTGFESCDSPA